MKSRLLLLLGSLLVLAPACGDKNKDDKKSHKDDDDDDDKPRKKGGKGSASAAASGDAAPTSTGATGPKVDLPPPPPGPTEMPKAPLTKDQLDAFNKDEGQKLTSDAFESLLIGLQDCEMDRYGIDYKCQAKKDFSNYSKHKNDDYKMPGKISLKHLRDPKDRKSVV